MKMTALTTRRTLCLGFTRYSRKCMAVACLLVLPGWYVGPLSNLALVHLQNQIRSEEQFAAKKAELRQIAKEQLENIFEKKGKVRCSAARRAACCVRIQSEPSCSSATQHRGVAMPHMHSL